MAKNFREIYEAGLTLADDNNDDVVFESTDDNNDESTLELADDNSDSKITPFTIQYELDEERRKIREEMSEVLTEEVKEELKEQLREQVKKELSEELFNQVYDSVQKDVLEHVLSKTADVNNEVLEAINKLSDKVGKLTENLNIEIPTPVVNVTIPKTRKKVIRDENGFIESIEDVEGDE
jgi:membrane-associated HD superfamily phosphohydrolase